MNTLRQRQREEKQKVLDHPMFGIPGERAPCKNSEFAEIVKRPQETISKYRTEAGVRPFSKSYDKSAGRDTRKSGKRRITNTERRAYRLCKLFRTWGRNPEIDEVLTTGDSGDG